jgi:HEPN domain-containing protein
MAEFTRDPTDWLRKLAPDEWIRAGLSELKRAEQAYAGGHTRAGAAGVKRAAGMALNAALIVEPDASWGRAYVEHLAALARDARVPEAVRSACLKVLGATPPGHEVIVLRTPRGHEAVLEAARDVIAHAWAVVRRNEAKTD